MSKSRISEWDSQIKNDDRVFLTIKSTIATIPISRGSAFALVDASDVPLVSNRPWFLATEGYAASNGDCKLMHHAIIRKKTGLDVDHANRKRLDNRRCNLRHAPRWINNLNSDKSSGVSWDKRREKWRARIRCNRVEYMIGRFDSQEDAKRLYESAKVAIIDGYFRSPCDFDAESTLMPFLRRLNHFEPSILLDSRRGRDVYLTRLPKSSESPTFSFIGTSIPGGKMIGFVTKSCADQKRMPTGGWVFEHQRQQIVRYGEAGAIAGVLAEASESRLVYWCPWTLLIVRRPSIPWSEMIRIGSSAEPICWRAFIHDTRIELSARNGDS